MKQSYIIYAAGVYIMATLKNLSPSPLELFEILPCFLRSKGPILNRETKWESFLSLLLIFHYFFLFYSFSLPRYSLKILPYFLTFVKRETAKV